ncbi:hypothetical protein C8F01DRAFT_207711 [Mycena amicta]|nr:hypothetical protein C8F01DRAFT_207711 [Mycena amicta]
MATIRSLRETIRTCIPIASRASCCFAREIADGMANTSNRFRGTLRPSPSSWTFDPRTTFRPYPSTAQLPPSSSSSDIPSTWLFSPTSIYIGGMSRQHLAVSNSGSCSPRGISPCPSVPATTSQPLRGTSSSSPLDRIACLGLTTASVFRVDSSPLAPYRLRLSFEHADNVRPSEGLVLDGEDVGRQRARMRAVCAVAMSPSQCLRLRGTSFRLPFRRSHHRLVIFRPPLYLCAMLYKPLLCVQFPPRSLHTHPHHHQHHYPPSTNNHDLFYSRCRPTQRLLALRWS